MSSFKNYYFKNIAIKVREYRVKNGYTQEQLSEMLGKNIKYIGHIERCERQISNEALVQLLEIFKIQPADFFNFSQIFDWN